MAFETIVQKIDRVERKTRSPKHTFQVRTRPFQFQPVAIAPVLPGETLMEATMQVRAVSDPIKNPLVGWHKEYGLWYVKLTDMYDRQAFMEMIVDPRRNMGAQDDATSLAYYHVNGGDSPAINWPLRCMHRVIDCYFRYQGENWDDFTINTVAGPVAMPAVPIARDLYLDSFLNFDDAIGGAYDENLTSAVAGQGDGTASVTASEIDMVMRRYNLARLHGITDMTYEDWLEAHGIHAGQAQELHEPEFLAHWRDWTYPTNTIDPTNGTPRSAVSWALNHSIKKPILFKEPGFLFLATWCRPKVYFENLTSNAVMLMNSAKDWSPALMSESWDSMHQVITAGDPPVDANAKSYFIDIKDIFMYGDQFLNFALTDAAASLVALPTAAGVYRYLTTDAELDGLFVGASPSNQIREDGVIQFRVKSTLRDTTPQYVGTDLNAP